MLDQDELSEIETENDETHFIPVDMLAQAWKLHALKALVKASSFEKSGSSDF